MSNQGEYNVTDTLTVELNREHPYAIEPSTDVFETNGSFTVAFNNEGAGRHVHLQLDGALATVGTLDDGTHFVTSGSIWSTTVIVRSSQRPIEGTLTITMGYGRETCDVSVRVVDPEPSPTISASASREQSSAHAADGPKQYVASIQPVVFSKQGVLVGSMGLLLAGIALLVLVDGGVVAGSVLIASGVGLGVYRLLGSSRER